MAQICRCKWLIYETSYIIGANGPAGHGQLVLGYDDNVGTPGDQGALLIQNSFGTGWPASAGATSSLAPLGMAYWSYNSFEQTQHLAAVALSTRARSARRCETLRQPARAARLNHRRISMGARRPTPKAYLILTHFFQEPVLLSHVSLTEPGGQAITATGSYGQNLSTGDTYLQRTDGNAFISGTWAVSLQSTNMNGNSVTYTGSIEVGQSEPNSLPEASMAGQTITDSTGAIASLSP